VDCRPCAGGSLEGVIWSRCAGSRAAGCTSERPGCHRLSSFRHLQRLVGAMSASPRAEAPRGHSGRHDDHPRIHERTGCEPRSDSLGSADDVIIGDHVAGCVPHNSCAGLNDILLIFVEHGVLPLAAGEHVQNRWRGRLKEFDGCLLCLAQIAPRGDRPWSGRGRAQCDDIRLGHPGSRQ
jgi:hypothetical protein